MSVVGSGSNLLVADEGVRGLVLKLDGELARVQLRSPRIVCGAGARLPALAAQAARAGLSGIEFGVNIPGSVGGAVRMNANAYGGQLAQILEWVDIALAAPAAPSPPPPGSTQRMAVASSDALPPSSASPTAVHG